MYYKNYKKNLFAFFVLIFITKNGILAQKSFHGNWEGEITTEKNGQTINSFEINLQINQEGDSVKVRSWIMYQELKAVFWSEGYIKKKTLYLNDLRLIEADALPLGEWCHKRILLKYSNQRDFELIEGTWQGNTSFSTCSPGKIKLRKIKRV